MNTKALLVRIEAKPGKDVELENFLNTGMQMAQSEAATSVWFGIRFGRSEYGIFDTFSDETSRDAHLTGPIAQALFAQVGLLIQGHPSIQKIDVLAEKLPMFPPVERDAEGLLLRFKAKAGQEAEVEDFLRGAQQLVEQEPQTTAWFALRLPDKQYGIFDVFPKGGRIKHIAGHVPRELTKHSLTMLGSFPDMELLSVIAEKLPLPEVSPVGAG